MHEDAYYLLLFTMKSDEPGRMIAPSGKSERLNVYTGTMLVSTGRFTNIGFLMYQQGVVSEESTVSSPSASLAISLLPISLSAHCCIGGGP